MGWSSGKGGQESFGRTLKWGVCPELASNLPTANAWEDKDLWGGEKKKKMVTSSRLQIWDSQLTGGGEYKGCRREKRCGYPTQTKKKRKKTERMSSARKGDS